MRLGFWLGKAAMAMIRMATRTIAYRWFIWVAGCVRRVRTACRIFIKQPACVRVLYRELHFQVRYEALRHGVAAMAPAAAGASANVECAATSRVMEEQQCHCNQRDPGTPLPVHFHFHSATLTQVGRVRSCAGYI
ncbi:uncharacterized protein LOC131152371 [Malania oleifera]|uniref:uncharacterized protein LOC131152371 n=1 Tax=Malania oleifera TaxID=397392 RepID=UPI0025AEABD1|nr:uncharacterized protein LOC131152371 [Malania oleifera]